MSLLQLSNVTAFYGKAQALYGVDLTVEPGQVTALMGRNGMGKFHVDQSHLPYDCPPQRHCRI